MGETAAGDTPSGVWPGSLAHCEPVGQGGVRQWTKKGKGVVGGLQVGRNLRPRNYPG